MLLHTQAQPVASGHAYVAHKRTLTQQGMPNAHSLQLVIGV